MIDVDVTCRSMRLEDVDDGLRLSMAEGWNQSKQDWIYLITNPDHICLAAIKNDKIIGTITAINYSNLIAWLGMVLVDKNHRGRGVSTALMTEILKQMQDCKSIKLDATPAGYEIYHKLDFHVEHMIDRMMLPAVKPDNLFEDKDLLSSALA